MSVYNVWVAVNTNRWGSPSVKVCDSKEEALEWGESVLKRAFEVLRINKERWENKTFAPGEVLEGAEGFTYYVESDFYIQKERRQC